MNAIDVIPKKPLLTNLIVSSKCVEKLDNMQMTCFTFKNFAL